MKCKAPNSSSVSRFKTKPAALGKILTVLTSVVISEPAQRAGKRAISARIFSLTICKCESKVVRHYGTHGLRVMDGLLRYLHALLVTIKLLFENFYFLALMRN